MSIWMIRFTTGDKNEYHRASLLKQAVDLVFQHPYRGGIRECQDELGKATWLGPFAEGSA
jgi:hypothetical protein